MTEIRSHSFYAMGCHMEVWLQEDEVELSEVERFFATAEQELSRFRPDSNLSQLNERPEQWVSVPIRLFAILQRAVDLAEETDGLFDPTLLSVLEQIGYQDSFEVIQKRPLWQRWGRPHDAVMQPPKRGYEQIRFHETEYAVWLPEGVKVDLGGIAKGYVAQEVIQWLSRYGACLLDAGGDLVAGPAPDGMLGWPVGVAAPYDGHVERPNLARMWLTYGCLATSGVDYRHWQTDHGEKHHIIDPRTGSSAETDLLTISLMMSDACDAEVWATTSLIRGGRETAEWLQRNHIEGLMINQAHQVNVSAALLPHIQWEKDAPTLVQL